MNIKGGIVMFCPNCGNKLKGNEKFCPNCGTKCNTIVNKKETLSETLAKKNPLIPLCNKVKNFILNNKKPVILGSCACLLIMIGLISFNIFYDFTKLSWDKDSDASISITSPTTLTLNVLAFDKEGNKITKIEFSTDAGDIESNGTSVEWKLPQKTGNFKITATAPSGKQIEKTIKVIKVNSKNLSGVTQESSDENADDDNDGIINREEEKLGTDKENADTDMDGLSDYYEVNVSKTDPLNKDSDNDSITDGDELDLGLNPLLSDSYKDGIKDGKRTLTYTVDNSNLGVVLEITGKGNIASSTIDVFSNQTFKDMEGLIDKVYDFYTDGAIEKAVVKITYNIEEVNNKGLNEDNLTLYYFDEDTKELEAIPTTVDKENKQISATVTHFSKYLIGDSNAVLTNTISNIMFVIDNSVSMYSEQQIIDAGYASSIGAVGNDTLFKRLTLTNKLVDMFTGNYKFGVAEFAGNYSNLIEFSDNHVKVKEKVNSMKSNWHVSTTGTAIVTALEKGVEEFSNKEMNNYLILLTDGKNTKGSLSSNKDDIIKEATDNNVKICVIGLGDSIGTDANNLNEIAESTGCDYYNASDANALDEIYSMIGANINYNYVDTNNDNKADGMIRADSGFLVNRDGFSFRNFRSNKSYNGHCYGMATFAQIYYENKLPLVLGEKETSRLLGLDKYSSEGYNLTNTYFSSNSSDKNLYDFKISNTGLAIVLGDIPSDYRDRIENKTWMIKNEYVEKLEEIDAKISLEKYDGKEEFSKYQEASLTIGSDKFNYAVSKDEREVINAIWRLHILQYEDERTTFSASPDKAFEELKTKLENKIPVVICINGNHAINAIKLIQDKDNANKFKLEIYDNNYPKETRYIEVTRKKYNKVQLNYTAWTNEYNYTFLYDSDNDGKKEDTTVTVRNVIIG